jgi:hypothetical protein
MEKIFAGLLCLYLPLPVPGGQPTTVPPGTPVTIMVTPAAAPPPPASITQRARHGHVTPTRIGFTHTGAGNIDVAQPTPDALVVTMNGVVVAGAYPRRSSMASMNFDLMQSLEVNFDNPKLKKAKLVIEGRVIGLLRSHCRGGGSAEEGPGTATVSSEKGTLVTLGLPPHSAAGGENMSLNDHDGPIEIPIIAGKYTLHQTFTLTASHPKSLMPCKAASAEFAPDPALDPLWISYWEPFHGAAKKDFGFQVTIKVVEDTEGTSEKSKK